MCIRHFTYLETEKTDFCHNQLHLPYHKTGNIGFIYYYSIASPANELLYLSTVKLYQLITIDISCSYMLSLAINTSYKNK